MDTWELDYYETSSGSCPVQAFLDSLSPREAERVIRKLDLLEALGTALDPPHVDHVDGRIWELRITGSIQHRVFYAVITGRRIVLLHAVTKKTPKARRKDIRLANQRLIDHEERHGDEAS